MPQYEHVKFLISLEKKTLRAYKLLSANMIKEIKGLLKREKLAKSEDKLPKGWTGEVPKIEVDLDDLLTPVVDKYLNALRYALLGKYAGKEAEEAAEETGLKAKIEAGTVPAAYLHSLDTQRQHYIDLFNKEAPEIPKDLMKESLQQIVKRTERFYEQFATEFKTRIITSVDDANRVTNYENANKVHSDAQDTLEEVGGEEAIEVASENVNPAMSVKNLDVDLKNAVNAMERKIDLATRSSQAMASAVATHQSFLEVYGAETDRLRVINVEFMDERTCGFCHEISRKPNGDWIYYDLSELQPAGFNFGRKKANWEISISPQHHRCRCQTVYVPIGFEADTDGSIKKK